MKYLLVIWLVFITISIVIIKWIIEWTQDEIGFLIQNLITHVAVHVPWFIALILLIITGGQILWVNLFTWMFRCIVGY